MPTEDTRVHPEFALEGAGLEFGMGEAAPACDFGRREWGLAQPGLRVLQAGAGDQRIVNGGAFIAQATS